MMALPGHELGLRLEFDSDVFDARQIEALVERFQRLLVEHDRRSGSPALCDGRT